MQISLIVAVDNNNAIGQNGDQLAYISDDLKRFKQITSGHTIIMGRKTYEALPNGALPNRQNIVVTRNNNLVFPECKIVSSAQAAIDLCKSQKEIFIIGGGEIYNTFMPLASTIYLTRIYHSFKKADTWLPPVNLKTWKQKSFEGPFTDTKSGLNYSFEVLERHP